MAEWHRERSKRQTNATSSSHYLTVGEEWFSKWRQGIMTLKLCLGIMAYAGCVRSTEGIVVYPESSVNMCSIASQDYKQT